MARYLIHFKSTSSEVNRYENADDAPQLLHKLGDKKILDQVYAIWWCQPVEFDIAYYQDVDE